MSEMKDILVSGNPLEKIIARAVENAAYRVNTWNSPEGASGDTPIEKILSLAILCEIYSLQTSFNIVRGLGHKERKIRHDRVVGSWETPLFMGTQFYALDWPVDFIFTVKCDGTAPVLVVECDGHDFHERTKAQARRDRSRDRRLQAAHYMIFRFTGSEIHSQCDMVARQILEWARSLVYEAASA